MGLMFQSLGYLMHHIQDMSVPLRTRNDSHFPWEDDYYGPLNAEKYDSAAVQKIIAGSNHNDPENQVVMLPRIIDYWDWRGDTRDRGTDRIGLSEFSSTNFISDDANFEFDLETRTIQRQSEFPLPYQGALAAINTPANILTNCKRSNSMFSKIDINALTQNATPIAANS